MKVAKKLKPGQPGTKNLTEKYGEDLVGVRYRYDRQQKVRTKTVEIVVESAPWEPPDSLTYIRVKYGEVALGKKVRAAGGTWNRQQQVWELPYKEVVRLKLTDRIVTLNGKNDRNGKEQNAGA